MARQAARLIGIDMGTMTTVTAVAQAAPQVIINALGARQTPSIVGYTRKGERLIGEFAKRQLMSEPERTLHMVRRFLGRRYDEVWEDMRRVPYAVRPGQDGGVAVLVEGRLLRPEELLAAVLAAARHSAEEVLGEAVAGAVITVPVSFSQRQRDAVRDAASLAGLEVPRLLTEPAAVALAWVAQHRRAGTLLVYDFGGASFDLAVVDVDRDGARVLASASQARLGGWDLDQRIIQWLIEAFYTEHLRDISREPMAMQRIRDAAERAKLELSSATETEIRLPFLTADESGPKHIQKTLTRLDFEAMVDDLLHQTLADWDDVLAAAGVSAEELDDVVLVGGTSRIPRVRTLVEERLGRALEPRLHPEEAVATGAALQAWMMARPAGAPADGAPATRLSIGALTEGGRVRRIIPRGTPLPATRRIVVAPPAGAADGATNLHLLLGESPRPAEGIHLGSLALPGPGPVEVEVTVDASGALHAEARAAHTPPVHLHLPAFTGAWSPTPAEAFADAPDPGDDTATPQSGADPHREELGRHLANLTRVREEHLGRLTPAEVADLDAALKRGRMAVLKTSERPAYFQEMSHYLFHFYTNLTTKLGG